MTGKGILIVEDENIVALDMRMRLEAMGYSVLDVVDTGSRAVERTVALGPDLVLMDIKLKGGVDGIDAARELREKTRAPVVFVTAFTDEKTLERAKLASPYGYVVKPFHERELRIAIELALYKHQYELSMLRAKDLAEEANRLKGEFLGNMSHELKTPLNSIIGFTELAMDKAVDAEQRELLAMALGSSKSLLALIDSVLDYTRLEAGRMALSPAPFSLDEIAGDCVDALAVEAYTKGLEAYYRRDPSLPDSLLGDSELLRHALLNLIDNAVKFTDSGSISLAVEAAGPGPEPRAAGEGRLELLFSVTDTGIGIAPDRIESAFERFTQLDASTTRRAGGTGLGLSIVKRNVELLGGSVRVESARGKGSRFELRVPFAAGAEPAPPRAPRLEGREVLVLGFDQRSEASAAEALASLGASARFAASAEAAGGDELVLADERALAGVHDQEGIGSLAGRLLVASRFGGGLRSRLSACAGLAFVPMPIRADGLSAALDELERGAMPAAAEPEPPKAAKAGSALAGLLEKLAEHIGRSAAGDRAEASERGLKAIRDELGEAGDQEGARMALSALILARKGDLAELGRLAERVREAAKTRLQR
ncbi:MAG TPA: ATP-binding protein [Spirochaetales bacterium]|nr:ATP-binding protein [Spirochaetales bacterium]